MTYHGVVYTVIPYCSKIRLVRKTSFFFSTSRIRRKYNKVLQGQNDASNDRTYDIVVLYIIYFYLGSNTRSRSPTLFSFITIFLLPFVENFGSHSIIFPRPLSNVRFLLPSDVTRIAYQQINFMVYGCNAILQLGNLNRE